MQVKKLNNYRDCLINKNIGRGLNVDAVVVNMNFWVALLFITGFVFVVIEMFHPGFGVPGVLGGILLILGVIFAAQTFMQAIILIAIILAVLGVMFTIVLIQFTNGKMNYIILKEKQNKEQGYIGTEDLNYFVGKEGITTSVLRPSGTGEFEGIRMDIVADGEFIDNDVKVKIAKVEGRRIVVKQLKK